MLHLGDYNKVIKSYRIINPVGPTKAHINIQQMLTVYYIQNANKQKTKITLFLQCFMVRVSAIMMILNFYKIALIF